MQQAFPNSLITKHLKISLSLFALSFPLMLPGANSAEPAMPTTMAQIAELEQLAASLVPEQIAPEEPPPQPVLDTTSRVVAQRVVVQDGRTITTQLLDGPPPAKPSPASVPVSPKPEEAEDAPESKPNLNLFLSNTVYNHAVTEMRWTRNERTYRVFINIDAGLFRSVQRIEGEKNIYSLILGIGDTLIEPGEIPSGNDFPGPDFFAASDISIRLAANNPPGIAETPEYQALSDLLTFYAANEHDLRWKQAVQKAENAARKRWHDANPKQPKDIILQYRPITKPAPVTSK